MKKALCVLLAVIFGFACFGSFAPCSAEAEPQANDYRLTGTYQQTAARTMTEMINEFRTGGEAWYWSSDDSEQIQTGVLGALTFDYALEQIAMQRAAELVVNFDHTRPSGEICFTCTYEGVQSYGENIAYGFPSAESVYIGWREDNESYSGQGHRRNMLNSGFTAVGIACFVYNGSYYWVQEFGYEISSVGPTEPADDTVSVLIDTGSGEEEEYVPVLQTCDISTYGSGFSSAAPGSTVTAKVVVNGEAAQYELAYQWYYKVNSDDSWHAISGATEATYRFTVKTEYDGWIYRCLISNAVSSVWSCSMKLTVDPDAVCILKQPEPVTADVGETVTFSVEARGSNLTYQWYYYEPDSEYWYYMVSGEAGQSSKYTFTASRAFNGCAFFCEVTNPDTGRYARSERAVLTVNADVRITKQPKDKTVNEGEKATFKVTAEGNVQGYQWYCRTSEDAEWTAIEKNGQAASYSFTTKYEQNGYQYMCAVMGEEDTVTSDAVTLTVIPVKPIIITQPKDKTVKLGAKAKLTVKAEDAQGGTLKYQWYYRTSSSGSWKKITTASGKKATYSFTAKAKHHGYQYRCLVTGSSGKIYTKTVTVSIKYGPKITEQPTGGAVSTGSKVKLKVTAEGKSLKYQWYYRTSSKAGWKKVSSASGKKAAYSFTATEKKNGWYFRCKVSSKYGTVYTKTVKLTVADANYRALLIGEEYFTWDTTHRNRADAEHMKTMLSTVTGPQGAKYTSTLKTDLGYDEVESAIKKTFAKTKDSDVSLFFIATHGNSDGDGELALTDNNNLDFGTLAGWLSKYVKGDIIVIIESCGAGSAIYNNGQTFDAAQFTQKAVEAFAAVEQQEMNAGVGAMRKSRFYVLAAAAHHQMSWGHEGSDPGNYFTDWLIEGIGSSGKMPADTNSDKIVTLKELYKYIQQYDSYTFQGTYHQYVQAYPASSTYKLFKRK